MTVVFPKPYEYRQISLSCGILPEKAEEAATLWHKLKPDVKRDPVVIANFNKYFKRIAKFGIETIESTEKLQLDRPPKKDPIPNAVYIEPPCIFIGRGDHPLRGTFKPRIKEKDVNRNTDPSCEWLVSWPDPITGKPKYLYPPDRDRSDSELAKFECARKLKKNIYKFRRYNNFNLQNMDLKKAQLAVCAYIIDKLCIRAGNEKDSDAAETVGCCTLQLKHVELIPPYSLKFDFLGKDSIQFKKKVSVDSIVFKHLEQFCKNKSPDDYIFDLVETSSLNNYLDSLVPGITAKVFRTCHGSSTFQKLLKLDEEKSPKEIYTEANEAAAKICNHKKTKGNSTSLSLTTSKVNYLDPRITVAFCKKSGMNIESVFSNTLLKKHAWALDTSSEFVF